jgi:pimeloyl-ACP methyl ester carboxylesterase
LFAALRQIDSRIGRQQDLVGLSSRGRQIMVPNSGHMIQLEQPGEVIDAIREIMKQVRNK